MWCAGLVSFFRVRLRCLCVYLVCVEIFIVVEAWIAGHLHEQDWGFRLKKYVVQGTACIEGLCSFGGFDAMS